jgi:hypothetical protein
VELTSSCGQQNFLTKKTFVLSPHGEDRGSIVSKEKIKDVYANVYIHHHTDD